MFVTQQLFDHIGCMQRDATPLTAGEVLSATTLEDVKGRAQNLIDVRAAHRDSCN